MIGMAAVLSLCEHAARSADGRSPQMIAQRLQQVACSGATTAQHLVRQLGARRLPTAESDARFPFFRTLCARAGLTAQPEIYLFRGATENAFALGDRAASVILVSEGLLARLDVREMSAVLAHEIGHILNGDARVLALTAELEQMIADAATATVLREVVARAGAPIAATPLLSKLLLFVVARVLATMLRYGLSRTREYDADRLAAGLMGDPFWLVETLRKLDSVTAHGARAPSTFPDPVGALMRSHPDAHERIARLTALPRARH